MRKTGHYFVVKWKKNYIDVSDCSVSYTSGELMFTNGILLYNCHHFALYLHKSVIEVINFYPSHLTFVLKSFHFKSMSIFFLKNSMVDPVKIKIKIFIAITKKLFTLRRHT